MAAGDAILLGGLWLLSAFGLDLFESPSPAIWHRGFIFHGAPVLVLAGFLLTALPRWTGKEAVPARSMMALILFWLSARGASFLAPAVGLFLASFFILSLTWIAAQRVWAARDKRNHKIVLLLLALFVAAFLSAFPSYQPFGSRTGVAAIVGLLIVIGGRVVPALTTSFADRSGQALRLKRSIPLEHLAAVTSAAALALWVLAPDLRLLGYLCLAAGAAQLVRLAQWQGWRFTGTCAVVGLHLGYLWIPGGFLLLGIHMLLPGLLGLSSAIHAWTIGVFGTLSLGIMSSMIRKHSGLAFSHSRLACLSLAAVTLAAFARLCAEVWPHWFTSLATAAAVFWIFAFGLFLAAFGRHLLRAP